MIVVTGARGQVGSRVNTMLKRASLPTIPVARAEGRTTDGRPFYVGDLTRPSTMKQALAVAEQIFLYPDFDREFVEMLDASRIRRIVLLSSSWVQAYPRSAIAEKHRKREDMLLELGIPYTILRPDTFMTNDHFWLPEIRRGVVRTAFPSALTAPISCRDIAATAAAAIRDGAFANERVLLTGDEVLSQQERVRLISTHLHTSIKVAVIDEWQMRERYSRLMPPPAANCMIDGMRLSETKPLVPAGAFAQIMKHAAMRYQDWLGGDESKFREQAGQQGTRGNFSGT